MPDIYLDEQIKIEYDPVTLTELFRLNAVGPCGWIDIDEVVTGYDASEYNHVNSSTGSDSTGDGTASLPYATEIKAIDSCTVDKPYVLIQDSGEYSGDYTVLDNEYYQGSFAASGETPKRCLRYIETELTDTNCVFVDSDTGDDGNAGTKAAPKATLDGAFDILSESKMYVKILNSDEYEIEGCELSEHLDGIFAAAGETPEILITPNLELIHSGKNEKISGDVLLKAITETNFKHVILSDSDRIAFAALSDTGTLKLYIITQAGVDVGETTVKTGMTWYDISVDSDGNIILAYCADNSHTIYWSRYDTDGDIVGSEYSISVSDPNPTSTSWEAYNVKIAGLDNGNIAISYLVIINAGSAPEWLWLHYQVVSSSGVSVKSQTLVAQQYGYNHSIVPKTSGFVITGISYDARYYDEKRDDIYAEETIYNYSNDGTAGSSIVVDSVNSPSALIQGDHFDMALLGNGYIVSAYMLRKASTYYYRITVHNGSSVVATYDLNASDTLHSLEKMPCGGVALNYVRANVVYFQFFDSTGRTIAETQACSNPATVLSQAGRKNGNLQLLSLYDGNIYSNEWFLSSFDGIKSDHAIEFNGVTISPAEDSNIDTLFDVTGKLTFKWCTVQDVALGRTAYSATAISSTAAVDYLNSVMKDSEIGADITANKAILQNSVFARITAGYAITVDGAAASEGDILIKNCTIFSNGGGIKLENNHGDNETLEGLILHDNADTGITAETEVTLTRSVSTDTLTNVALSNVIQSNPAFVNEGYINPDNMNLDLMSKLLGYLRTSPAIGLCSDSKNAGAYDVLYVGVGVNWSSITVRKPEVIPIQRIYAGAVNLQLANGDYDSYHEGRSEKIELKFQGVENDEYDDLDKIMSCVKNSLKVYFAPTTRPDEYFAFKLLRETINAGNSFYILDQYGKEDFSIFIARAYERTDG